MKTKNYSWSESLYSLGMSQPWQDLEEKYRAELTEDLAAQSSNYEKIEIDGADGHLWICVHGAKPRLRKLLEDNYGASDIEGESLH